MEADFLDLFGDTVSVEKLAGRAASGAKRSFDEPVLYVPGGSRGGAHISSKQELIAGMGSEQIVSGGAIYLPADDVSTTLTPEDRLTVGDITNLDDAGRASATHPNIITVAIPRDAAGPHHVKVYLR